MINFDKFINKEIIHGVVRLFPPEDQTFHALPSGCVFPGVTMVSGNIYVNYIAEVGKEEKNFEFRTILSGDKFFLPHNFRFIGWVLLFQKGVPLTVNVYAQKEL